MGRGWADRGWLTRDALPVAVIDGTILRYAYGAIRLGAQDAKGLWKHRTGATEDPRWHHACVLVEIDMDPQTERDVLGDDLARPFSLERWCDEYEMERRQSQLVPSTAATEEEPDLAPPANTAALAVLLVVVFVGLWVAGFVFILYPLLMDPKGDPWQWHCSGATAGWGTSRCVVATGNVPRGVLAFGNCPVGIVTMSWNGLSFGIINVGGGVAVLFGLVSFLSAGFTVVGGAGVAGVSCVLALVWNNRGTQILPFFLSERRDQRMDEMYGPAADAPLPLRSGTSRCRTVLWRVDFGPSSAVYFSPFDWSTVSQRVYVKGGWRVPRRPRSLRLLPRNSRGYQLHTYNCQDYVHEVFRFLASERRRPVHCCCLSQRLGGGRCSKHWRREDDSLHEADDVEQPLLTTKVGESSAGRDAE